MDTLNETAKKYDMKVNVRKTKAMVIAPEEGIMDNITIDGEAVKQGHLNILSNYEREWNRYWGGEIKNWNRKVAVNESRELVTTSLTKELKKRMIKTLVWPVALHGYETWTMKQEIMYKLKAFEMWVWRRMEKMSCKDMKMI
jgi:hypothetical protein